MRQRRIRVHTHHATEQLVTACLSLPPGNLHDCFAELAREGISPFLRGQVRPTLQSYKEIARFIVIRRDYLRNRYCAV